MRFSDAHVLAVLRAHPFALGKRLQTDAIAVVAAVAALTAHHELL